MSMVAKASIILAVLCGPVFKRRKLPGSSLCGTSTRFRIDKVACVTKRLKVKKLREQLKEKLKKGLVPTALAS